MSLEDRVKAAAALVAEDPREPWLVWCELNDESVALAEAIPGAEEICGSDSADDKETAMANFTRGAVSALVTKPSIAGWGLNWQHCARVVFVGVSHSFESWYQAIRRVYRFGQKRPVEIHVVTSDADGSVVANLKRKQRDAEQMIAAMVREMAVVGTIRGTKRDFTEYAPKIRMIIPEWVGIEPGEEWRDCLSGVYRVTNTGRVRRAKPGKGARHGRELTRFVSTTGYPAVNVCIDGGPRLIPIHHLVAEAFIGPRPPGLQINHKDGNKLNPAPENLEYVTQAENAAHAGRTGLVQSGDDHWTHRAKI